MSRPASEVSASVAVSAATAFQAELDHVYRTFRRLGAQPAEAEDLAQEVFLVAWRRWSHYDPDRPLRPWLTGIAHHVALDQLGKHRRRELATENLEQEDEGPGPEDQLSSARARHLALRALAVLSERHRSILVQHDLEGITLREIAEKLSLPFFTTASRLRRARLRFAKVVKQLQPREGKRALSAEAVLEAERTVPALSPPRRARILSGLTSGASGLGGAARPVPAQRSLPLAPAAAAVVGCVLAVLLLWPRDREIGAGAPAVKRPAQSPLAAPAGLARGLVGLWRFDDGAGDIAADSSGRGHPCLLHDLDPRAAWVSGRVGGALDLGRRGWLECPLPEAKAGVPFDLSVAVWIKRVRQRPFSALFTRQLPSGDGHHLFWFGLRDDLLTVYSDSWVGWTSRTLTSFEGWTHVAFVHTGGETRLYVDGTPVRTKSGQLPRGEGVVQSSLTIGSARRRRDPLDVQHHFDGLVDEAIVFDRPLSDAEVATLANP